eukprot:CCRYP_010486-RA/>CCRYP_010486-RA protein AED:0.64 eAED:0.46 QI:0/0/0/1/0/0/2/0/141
MKHYIQLILVGDSDISRWPSSLYPQCSLIYSDLGQSGAVLSDLIPQLRRWRAEDPSSDGSLCERMNVFVACAGENDIGSGRSLESLLETFRSFVDELFAHEEQERNHKIQNYLIFLGPKFSLTYKDYRSNQTNKLKVLIDD